MRHLLLISSFFFSCLSFGQDSLTLDNTSEIVLPTIHNVQLIDTSASLSRDSGKTNRKQKKRRKKAKVKEDPIVSPIIEAENTKTSDNESGISISVLLIFAGILLFAFSRSVFGKPNKQSTASSPDHDNFITDYVSRILLPRREYYREVYLKSDAWKRKRYVVLKRDNWKCVYCGGRATEVHHKRYAKINIGKEPIEWLVSICRSCHDAKHN